ncbi:MAG: hypothetical protein GY940_12230, partial [bacterium]|nr:hypothetical protein [bacterium]
MRRKLLHTLFFTTLASYFLTNPAFAAQISQNFSLASGWNAVFLEVDPVDDDPAAVFDGISDQLVSVWMWNPNTGTVEFIQNPAELTPANPHYLTYIPDNPVLTTLHAIHGNKGYLFQTSEAATLTVTGEPLLPKIDWKPNSFNLVGFHLRGG